MLVKDSKYIENKLDELKRSVLSKNKELMGQNMEIKSYNYPTNNRTNNVYAQKLNFGNQFLKPMADYKTDFSNKKPKIVRISENVKREPFVNYQKNMVNAPQVKVVKQNEIYVKPKTTIYA